VIGIVSPRDISRAIELGDLRPLDPYQGPRGADIAAVAGVASPGSPETPTAGSRVPSPREIA
jgi:hypothetical protein